MSRLCKYSKFAFIYVLYSKLFIFCLYKFAIASNLNLRKMSTKTLLLMPILLISCLLQPLAVYANHLVGGEMTYQCLSPGEYEITLTIYRDCLSLVNHDDLIGGLFNASTLEPLDQNLEFNVLEDDIEYLPQEPSINCALDVCRERGQHKVNLALPANDDGYIVSVTRCCRSSDLLNILSPATTGFTCFVLIPPATDPEACANNSAKFSQLPLQTACVSEDSTYELGAQDSDGDELLYRLCSAIIGGSPEMPNPDPIAPPYEEALWNEGYSTTMQLSEDSELELNPETGTLTFNPAHTGNFLLVVCADEYRDGVLINTTRREFTIHVQECFSANLYLEDDPEALPNQDGESIFGCAPFTISPSTEQAQGRSYIWEFGNGETQDDIANPDPVTYEEAGTYELSLIIKKDYCQYADTTTLYLQVDEAPGATFEISNPTPQIGAPIQLTADNSNEAINEYYWDMGEGSSLEGPIIEFTYNSYGDFEVCLTVINMQSECASIECQTLVLEPPIGIEHVQPNSDLFIALPNAFSPNSDGINDVLKLTSAGIATIDFRVFDRIGKEMFRTSDPAFSWDGSGAQRQKTEVFVYQLSATSYSGKTYIKTGTVTMIK